MCGIVGVFGAGGASLPPREQREASLESLSARGPDARAHFEAPALWMGHTRLAVFSVDDGEQPVFSEDKSIVAVVNGEIYGFERHRRELRALGHRFRTGSDSEVLVHLYEEYGAGCFERIDGELACILFDSRRKLLLAARDRFGVKPLLWTRLPSGAFAFASEAKALFALGLPSAWDEHSFLHAATHQYLPPDRTLFASVHSLPPAHVMRVDIRGQSHLRSYWDLDAERSPDPALRSKSAAAEALRTALEKAVHRRLRGDVPVAFALSGGLDSSSILALANSKLDYTPEAFGVCFQHAPYDERESAREVARFLGAKFHPVEVSQEDLLDALPAAVRASEGLAINGQLPAKYLLAKAIGAAGYKVVLTGEGADELLLGYPHLLADYAATLSSEDSATLSARLLRDYPACRGIMLPDAADSEVEVSILSSVETRFGFVPSFLRTKLRFGARLLELFDEDAVGHFLGHTNPSSDPPSDPLRDLLASPFLAPTIDAHPVSTSASLWTRLALAGYILRTLGDGTEMAFSIEGRPPFLDREVAELCLSMPVSQRMAGGQTKAVLRDAMAGLLPETTLKKPKHPFLAPPLAQFSTPRSRALVQDVLRSGAMQRLPFVERGKLERFLDRMPELSASERARSEPILFTLLSAALLGEQLIGSQR